MKIKILLCSDWYSGSKSATSWNQPLQILVKSKPDIGQIQSVPKLIDMSYLFHLVSILHEGGRTILWIYRHINRLVTIYSCGFTNNIKSGKKYRASPEGGVSHGCGANLPLKSKSLIQHPGSPDVIDSLL